MMRKLTASILGTAVLAGGALTGIAAAAPSSHHHQARTELQARDRSSVDRAHHAMSREHAERSR
jgi:hypothetical protein